MKEGTFKAATNEEILAMQFLTESAWQNRCFVPLFKSLGWSGYHETDSRDSRGKMLDWTLWRERILFVELKAEGGRVSNDQSEIMSGLEAAGGEVRLWYPRMWRSIELELARYER